RLLDLRPCRIRIAVEIGLSGHDHAVHAEAALGGLFVDEGLLQRMRVLRCSQPLQGRNRGVRHAFDWRNARTDRPSAYVYGACSALPESAAKFWPPQPSVVTEHIEQRRGWIYVERTVLIVDSQGENTHAAQAKPEVAFR